MKAGCEPGSASRGDSVASSSESARASDPVVEIVVGIMRKHGLRITPTDGTDGPGDLWTAARDIIEALTGERR